MSPDDRERWNARYAAGDRHARAIEPLPFLARHLDLLPRGAALDLATGGGRNALHLAANGFRVTAVDVSEEALKQARALAAARGVEIAFVAADLEGGWALAPESYAVIVCTYYLQRSLFVPIREALRPGGVAFLETYTLDHRRHHPDFPRRYLLEPGELLQAVAPLRILRYQDVDDGRAAYASVLARKEPHHGGPIPSESRKSRIASK